MVPHPRFGIDGFTHRTEQTQRTQVVLVRVFVTETNERTDRGRRRVEDVDAPLLDQLPPAVGPGVHGHAFVHHRCRTGSEWAVDNIRMARDPTDVRGAPIDVTVLDVEDRLEGGGDVGEVATCCVQDALGLSRAAAGVEDEQRMFRIELCRRALRARILHQVVPPKIAALLHFDVLLGAFDDDHRVDGLGHL